MADEIGTLTFRLLGWQRRRVVLQWLALVAAATGLTVARTRFPEAPFPLGPWVVGAWIVVAIGCYTVPVMLTAFTECSPDGLRARTMQGPVEVAWDDITSITLSTTPLSRTHRVLLTTRQRRRIYLVAPLSGRGVRSEQFFEDVAMIDAYWRRAVSSAG